MIGGYQYALATFAVVVVGVVSGRVGYGLADGQCNAGKLEVARAYAEAQNGAVEAGRRASEEAEARIAKLRRRQAQSLSRAEGVSNELANLPRRPDGDFTADELRVLTRLHAELFPADAGGVPGGVQGSPGTE